jgi:flagellar biosynthesis chaperone FliJ
MADATNDSPKTIQAFTEELLKMLHNLMEAQAKHEEVNKKMIAQCIEEENFRRKEVNDAKNALNASSGALSKCQASLHAAEENLPALLKARKEYQEELAKKTAERVRQHQLYVQRATDWKDAISFLDEFMRVVKQKLANYPHTFAELGEKLLKHASKLGRIAEAVPVLIAMTQSPAENEVNLPHVAHNYKYAAQGKTVNTLNAHLASLRNKLAVDAKQNDLDEEKAVKLFNELKARLEGIIAKLSSDIASTEKQIAAMKNCVATENAIIATANNKLQRNATLRSAASHTCSDFASEFVKATKNRLEEIKTVQQIIDIVKKRFATLPHDLVSYLEEVKNHFRTYVNSTQFKKYEEYVQKHVADNAHGRTLSQRPNVPNVKRTARKATAPPKPMRKF